MPAEIPRRGDKEDVVLPVPVRFTASLFVALAGLAPAAFAQTTYDNFADFDAATTTTVLEDFEGIAPDGAVVTNPDLSPLTISVPPGEQYSVSDRNSTFGALDGNGSLFTDLAPTTAPTITFAVGQQTNAFGIQFIFADEGGAVTSGTLSGQLFNGATPVGVLFTSPSANGFFGVSSDAAFDRVSLTLNPGNGQGNSFQLFDNVRVGSVDAVVPEPSSAVLALGALPLIGLIARRRR